VMLMEPPHSIQAEQAVIAAVLMTPDCLLSVSLTGQEFYRGEHKLLWGAIKTLSDGNKPVDAITVSEVLRDDGKLAAAGGIDYLGELIGSSQSAANIGHYAGIVRDKFMERQLIAAGHRIADSGYNEPNRPVLERLAEAQASLMEITDTEQSGEPIHMDKALKAAINEIDDRSRNGGGIAGISSGFKDVDKLIGGFKKGEMILVAARPSMGKSTLAQNFLEHSAIAGRHVLFFSVEMPEAMVATRHIASIGKVPLENLVNAQVDEYGDNMMAALMKLKGRHYHIDDTPSLVSTQILPRAQRVIMKAGKPLDLIVVDYLQKLRDVGDNQNVRIQEISGNIKHAARVLNCPIIALSQLSRECEKRNDKRPMLSDLRDSGSLEQDADVVMFIYRDEVYNELTDFQGIAELLVRKNRNGATGNTFLTSRLDYARFENFSGMLPMRNGRQKHGLD